MDPVYQKVEWRDGILIFPDLHGLQMIQLWSSTFAIPFFPMCKSWLMPQKNGIFFWKKKEKKDVDHDSLGLGYIYLPFSILKKTIL